MSFKRITELSRKYRIANIIDRNFPVKMYSEIVQDDSIPFFNFIENEDIDVS